VLRNSVARRFVFEEAFGQGDRSALAESDKRQKRGVEKRGVCRLARGSSPDTEGQRRLPASKPFTAHPTQFCCVRSRVAGFPRTRAFIPFFMDSSPVRSQARVGARPAW